MAWFIDSMSFMLISCVLLSMILVVNSFSKYCVVYPLISNLTFVITVWSGVREFEFSPSVHFRFEFQYCHSLLQLPSLNLL